MLALLRQEDAALSHAEVADMLVDRAWDKATIYRNLIDLAEVGLLRRLELGDHTWRFEAASHDRTRDEHPHFVCTDCGTVECLRGLIVETRGQRVPRSVRNATVEVQLRGLCNDCG